MAIEYGIIALPSNPSSTPNHYEMGWQFTVNEEIKVSGLRVYLPTAQTVVGHLWGSSSTAIGTVTIVAQANTWSEALFDAPITLTTGTTYTISCYNESNRYYASASALTYNSKVNFVSGVYNSSRNYKPTSKETGSNYPFIDIVIGSKDHKPSGTAIIALANYTVGGDDALYWTATTPTGTSVAVSTSVNNGAWQSIANAGTIQGLPARGQTCNLRVKIDLATTDSEQTPTVSDMTIRSAEDRKVLVLAPTMPSDLRGNVGNMSVSYDGLGGLQGVGGPTAEFTGTFTPMPMVWRPNPNDEEHIALSVGLAATLTAITYQSGQEPTEHVEMEVAAAITLTDIHDL